MAHTCKRCNSHEENNWISDVKDRLAYEQLCHTCSFWREKIAIATHPSVVRFNGTHYRIGPETSDGGFRGFGGSTWVVAFHNHRVVFTSNLWCQGDIPPAFRKELPDNCILMSRYTADLIIEAATAGRLRTNN